MKRSKGQALVLAAFLIAAWGAVSYVVLPTYWHKKETGRKAVKYPGTTVTREGLPGDPVNVGLVGTTDEVFAAMDRAGWQPADPKSVRSVLRVAKSIIFKRHYYRAPVSNLYLFDRKEDIAFEQSASTTPWRRHHVRFWMSQEVSEDGRPVWVGAATFDRNIGLSRYTGQITHHISPDIDAERDKLIGDLINAGALAGMYVAPGAGGAFNRRNGEGDRYFTDGEMIVGEIRGKINQ